MKRLIAIALSLTFIPAASQAAVKTETITYKVGDKTHKGYLAYDDATRRNGPAFWSCTNSGA